MKENKPRSVRNKYRHRHKQMASVCVGVACRRSLEPPGLFVQAKPACQSAVASRRTLLSGLVVPGIECSRIAQCMCTAVQHSTSTDSQHRITPAQHRHRFTAPNHSSTAPTHVHSSTEYHRTGQDRTAEHSSTGRKNSTACHMTAAQHTTTL